MNLPRLPTLPPLRLGHRLALGFAIVIALLMGVAALGLRHLDALSGALRETVEVRGARADVANAMAASVGEATQGLLYLMQAEAPEEQAEEIKALEAALARYEQARQRFGQGAAHDVQTLAAVDEAAQGAGAMLMTIRDLARRGSDLRAAAATMDPRGPQQRWLQAVAKLVEHEREASARAYEEAQRDSAAARRALIVTALAAVVAATLAGRWILRGVTQPVSEALAQVQAIASGDLARRPQSHWRRDEMGELLAGQARMRDGLRALVGEVRDAVGQIGIASGEIANGHADLAKRSDHVAARLQRMVSAMSEVVAAGERIATLAAEAKSLADAATGQATRGGALFERVVATMRGIDGGARQISEIVGAIDAIAMQTNILAINASVEAARAGQAGHGFAVVADQVRELAQRSADSARQIKGLIGDAVRRIGEGVQEVGAAESSMRGIVTGAQRVAEVVAGTTDALAAQRHGLEAVSNALTDLKNTTRQNAALVEHGAAATASLNSQAAGLARSIHTFRLEET